METNLLKSICSGIILSAFFSCSNEIPIEQINLAFNLEMVNNEKTMMRVY